MRPRVGEERSSATRGRKLRGKRQKWRVVGICQLVSSLAVGFCQQLSGVAVGK